MDFGRRPDGTQGSKKAVGAVWPEKAILAMPGLNRYEPFLMPLKFKKRFMFGIPLIAPLTQEKLTNEDLKDYIQRAANMFEMDTKCSIMPVVHRWRLPFDPNLYHQFIFLEIPIKPVQQILKLAICSASYTQTGEVNENSRYPRGAEIYTIPNEWVDMGNAGRGYINVNPINPAFTAIGTNSAIAGSGAAIMQFIGQQGWVPSYWNVEAMCGLSSKEGQVPVVVNEAIGLQAVILLLNNLIPQYRITSQSLNMDGLGQSTSDQLYALLQFKLQEAKEAYAHLVQKIKAVTGSKFFSGNV